MSAFRNLLFATSIVACSGSGTEMPTSEEPIECPIPGEAGALVLDGVDDLATAGMKPELGLEKLTVEAWIRRDGAGVTMTSGAGGLRLVPIVTKGLGEGDGSNIDCNYAFGLWGDVLGADFEDAASGANHPVFGKTAIPVGEWHHVAATYDGMTWRLYLDGKLDGEATANATPRADSVHPFTIGSSIDSMGVKHGFFAGAIDEVRVWDHARAEDELADAMHETVVMGDGLLARWSLDADGADTIGLAPLTIEGEATFATTDVVPLDQGAPPIVASSAPADGTMTGTEVALDVSLEMAMKAPVDVTYHLRELGEMDDFTIVVMPDTQIYTIEGRNLEKYFNDQTKWIRAHRAEYNIVGVIHNGDVINNEPQIYQWNVASKAMATLEKPEADLPDGMPYGVGVGNHDNKLTGDNTVLDTTRFNQFFGVARYAGKSYYGGHYGTKNDHSWVTFSAGGVVFVVVSLMYELDPDPAAIAWARSIFQMHPDAFGILNTHYLLSGAGNFSAQAKQIYAALKDLPNVHLMTGGHVSAESRRVDKFEGHVIHSMLADYQSRTDGGAGYMRIWEFSPASQTVSVRSYSPTLDKFETDANSEFTLDVDLKGFGGPFRDITVSGTDLTQLSTTIPGLAVGKTYEWYADVASCGKRTSTPIARFTVAASEDAARKINKALEQPPGRNRAKRVTGGAVDSGPDDPSLAD